MAAPDVLHVTNGDSVVATLRDTRLGGDQLAWRDVLHEGPVPEVEDVRLRELRADFLADGFGSRDAIVRELAERDRRLDAAIADGRRVVLWFEHDLYDQLQLLQVLARIGEAQTDPAHVELVCVDRFPGVEPFHGLGQLSPPQLESLWPSRRPVTRELVAAARRAWAAFRAPEPVALADVAAAARAELPFLAPAVRRLLEELPSVEDGLARSERQLLEAVADGRRTGRELYIECQRREEAPFSGDAWTWTWLLRLATGPQPLVAGGGGAVDGAARAHGFSGVRFALTDSGRAVLDAEADAVALRGIDRWLGGTHLHAGNVWRYDASAGRVVPPTA